MADRISLNPTTTAVTICAPASCGFLPFTKISLGNPYLKMLNLVSDASMKYFFKSLIPLSAY